MRAEVKVGLIVGVVAIAGGAIWWFSGNPNELDYLPIDKPAVDATAPGDTTLVKDETPTPTGSRRPARSAPERHERTLPTPAPARRTTPTPSEGTSPPGERASRAPDAEPSEKPAETSTIGDEPVITQADRAAADTTSGIDRSRPADSPPPVVELPRRRDLGTTPGSPRPSRQKTYTIQPGDYLITIAEEEYGDGQLWKAIKAANPDLDENCLRIGETIKLPALAEATRLMRAEGQPGADRETRPAPDPDQTRVARATYMVERGDSLIKIARNVLDDDTRWREIFELNRDRLDSPDVLRVGMELRLPASEDE